jgi:DNA-directed RNA polymerase specialized sigma24 family protein
VEGEVVQHLNAYFYGVAKRVLLEWRRRRVRERAAELEYAIPGPAEAAAEREARGACLERCVGALDEVSRALLAGYYRGLPDDRKRLAETHGITYTTLKTRVFRLRVRLDACLRACLEARGRVTDDDPATPRVRRS